MTERSVAHGTFVVERRYPAPPAKVFSYWSDAAHKRSWFGGPEDAAGLEYSLDFRVGGREHLVGPMPDGGAARYDALFYDIVPDNRIIYSYDMDLGAGRISVSLAVAEFLPDGAGTHLRLTEYGAYLDGLDKAGQRSQGTEELLDALGVALARA